MDFPVWPHHHWGQPRMSGGVIVDWKLRPDKQSWFDDMNIDYKLEYRNYCMIIHIEDESHAALFKLAWK